MDRKREQKRPGKRFNIVADRTNTRPDKDNAQLKHPAPKNVPVHNLNLAPPGMSGIKTNERLGLPPQPSKRPRLHHGLGKPSDVRKEFKGVAGQSKENEQALDR